jgi:hypothetical protein
MIPESNNLSTPTCFYFILLAGGSVINIQTQGAGRLPDVTLKNVDYTNISNNAVVIILTLIFFR